MFCLTFAPPAISSLWATKDNRSGRAAFKVHDVAQFVVTDLSSSRKRSKLCMAGVDNAALARAAQTAQERHEHTIFSLFAKTPTIENEAGR
jgi:hypothetical protein